MALIYKQTVVQEATEYTPKRRGVQYYDDVALENKQVFVYYSDLTAQQQTDCDTVQSIDESKMI